MSPGSLPHYRPLPRRNVVPLSLALASALALASPSSRAAPPPVVARPLISQAAPATQPAAPKPAAPKPTQPKPAAGKPTGAQAPTQPVSPRPASTRPASTKPVSTRPATGKPATARAAAAPALLPALKPGQFVWMPELAPEGPVVAVVSLPEQRVHVYRNGVRIGISTISSGRRGFETITGTFPILERQTEHYSNLYDNAPMPFMLRLTWSGTALHAGHLPGYPASHGCVRLPKTFAQLLFDSVRRGTVVVIADAASHPVRVVSPGWITPIDPATGAVLDDADAALAELWAPERAPEGPVTLLLSTRDRRLTVLRNGIEIGHAEATITGEPAPGTRPHGLRVEAIATDAPAGTEDPRIVATTTTPPPPVPALRWQAIAQPGKPPATAAPLPLLRGGELRLSASFARSLQAVLPVESTLVITDEPLRPVTATPQPAPPTSPPPANPSNPPPASAPPASMPPAPPSPTTAEPAAPLPAPPDTATPVTPPPPTPAQTPQPGR